MNPITLNYLFPSYFFSKLKLDRENPLTTEEWITINEIRKELSSSHLHMKNAVKHSKEKNLLHKDSMQHLYNKILSTVNNLAIEVFNLQLSLEMIITQSWLVVGSEGEMSHDHTHANSIFSGVYYIQTNDDDSIVFLNSFMNSNKPNHMYLDIFDKSKPMKNALFRQWERVKVTSGELIIFPSNLSHRIEKIQSSKTRLSIAFNTFVKGTLGSKESSTELIV